ncbi:5-dehydro-4-deoxyglucarate dehydratase [Streptomyces spirodelae]|uniref:Probable 5-dehydro-4-deoxyglucarate dehydratase n=1 Tax=Streptomyces spirodelae TaxID=2812904 RepID=A0ABS3WYY6_9ACTN|nr:5-dehydro-4-deoxyglucarate dehydratase [Streptomyces spirodelae]MBO8188337.1 5-dehydro-4-deoxyglucarate dehydratase [Streptomyces spirodelae]
MPSSPSSPPPSPATGTPNPGSPASGPAALAERLDGLLFFPVTAFAPDGTLDLDAFRTHVRRGVDAGAGAVFACCGTGEFHALAPEEFGACVAAAVAETGGRVPVLAGAGYGPALAREFAHRAAEAGADGLLAMPPYLVAADQDGLVRHYTELADATSLPTVVYQRDNALFTPEAVVRLARHPRIIGLKDGLGDPDLLQRIVTAVRGAGLDGTFRYFNGLPTAELTGLAYRGLGVSLYSSAVFCFAPEIALAFHQALETGDEATVRALLDGFYVPFVELRNQRRGYAVSLVKAGVRLRGLDVGGVRPPLSDPAPDHVEQLGVLLERGLEMAAALSGGTSGARAGGGAH